MEPSCRVLAILALTMNLSHHMDRKNNSISFLKARSHQIQNR